MWSMDEFEFIKWVSKDSPRTAEGLLHGIGDDAAVIEGPRGEVWLISTDVLAEGIHFERDWCDSKMLGRKALLVNISDIAAMGGIPWFYFVSISCPYDMTEAEILGIFEGMKDAAKEYSMILAGGDTTESKKGLFISVTVVGCTVRDNIVLRDGAEQGDFIYVSGALGGSAAGLYCLKNKIFDKSYEKFISRHLLPSPRIALGGWLAKNKCASSMIDISDGLISDLAHITSEKGVGYRLFADDIPMEGGLKEFAASFGIDIYDLVLASGEEYELLFTMSGEQEREFFDKMSRIDFGCSVTKIGEVGGSSSNKEILTCTGEAIRPSTAGYVHKVGRGR